MPCRCLSAAMALALGPAYAAEVAESVYQAASAWGPQGDRDTLACADACAVLGWAFLTFAGVAAHGGSESGAAPCSLRCRLAPLTGLGAAIDDFLKGRIGLPTRTLRAFWVWAAETCGAVVPGLGKVVTLGVAACALLGAEVVRTQPPSECMATASQAVQAVLQVVGARGRSGPATLLHTLNVEFTVVGAAQLFRTAACFPGRRLSRVNVHALVTSGPSASVSASTTAGILMAGTEGGIPTSPSGAASGAPVASAAPAIDAPGPLVPDHAWALEEEGSRLMRPGTSLGSGSFGHAVVVAFDGVGGVPVVCKTAVERRGDPHQQLHREAAAGARLVAPIPHAARAGVCGRADFAPPTGSRRAMLLAFGAGGHRRGGGAGGGPLLRDERQPPLASPDHPDATPLSALQWEAQVLLSISHPNVLRALRYDSVGVRGPCLTLEFCHGTLTRLLQLDGDRLSVALRCDVAAQTCRGLAAVHAKGIVHYDVAPRNLLVLCLGRASLVLKVADLGCSRRVGPAGFAEHRNTPNCCRVPEVADGVRAGNKRCVTTALDVFVFARDVVPVLFPAQYPLPRALCDVVGRCLSTDPTQRPTMHHLSLGFNAHAAVCAGPRVSA